LKLKLAIFSVFLVGLVLGAVVMGAAVSLVQIQNIGTIRSIGVEVYADGGLSQILCQIAWGTLDRGESASFSAWIKNTGSDAQRLVLWTENWNPADPLINRIIEFCRSQNYVKFNQNVNADLFFE